MKSTLKILCLLSLILTISTMVIAGEGGDHICFRSIDADQDGKVTFVEFALVFGKDERKFKAVDVNGDGVLTHAEYHRYLGHGAAGRSQE